MIGNDPQSAGFSRHGITILFGMLAVVPVLMLVIGVLARQWQIAIAALPMGGFFACAGRASWVRAQSRAALLAGDLPARKRLVTRAALWGLAASACIALAILLLNVGD